MGRRADRVIVRPVDAPRPPAIAPLGGETPALAAEAPAAARARAQPDPRAAVLRGGLEARLGRPELAGAAATQGVTAEAQVPKHPVPRGVVTSDNWRERKADVRRRVEQEVDERLGLIRGLSPAQKDALRARMIEAAMQDIEQRVAAGDAIVVPPAANDADAWIRQHAGSGRGYDLPALVNRAFRAAGHA